MAVSFTNNRGIGGENGDLTCEGSASSDRVLKDRISLFRAGRASTYAFNRLDSALGHLQQLWCRDAARVGGFY